MLKLENTEALGWEHAIRGMRNPMNSWEKSDSYETDCDHFHCGDAGIHGDCTKCLGDRFATFPVIGHNDHDLMMRLAKGGPVHAKYRRMIVVYVDITAPLYWWKEFDTYKVGTVANSCSTMHKIAAKEFTLEDFSHEHLIDYEQYACDESECLTLQNAPHIHCGGLQHLNLTINVLNFYREKYLETGEKLKRTDLTEAERKHVKAQQKRYWWQMIQLLPTNYNQKRTVMLNYEVLAGVYPMRKDHKLDEWHTFCDWIESLPYSELITGMSESEKMVRIGEKLHEGLVKGLKEGKEIDWKKANPGFADLWKPHYLGKPVKITDVSIMPDGTAEPRFVIDPEDTDEKE